MSTKELTPEQVRIRTRHAELSTEEWRLRQRAEGLQNGKAWEWTAHIRDERLQLERERVAEEERIASEPAPEPANLTPSQWCLARAREQGIQLQLGIYTDCLDWMAAQFSEQLKNSVTHLGPNSTLATHVTEYHARRGGATPVPAGVELQPGRHYRVLAIDTRFRPRCQVGDVFVCGTTAPSILPSPSGPDARRVWGVETEQGGWYVTWVTAVELMDG